MVGLAITDVTGYGMSLCVTFFRVLRRMDNIVAKNVGLKITM